MAIVLGTYLFDDVRAAVSEKQEEIGGRDARVIQIKGLLDGYSSIADLESELDAIMTAASESGESTALSLRAGRRLWVRRAAFTREIRYDALTGAFTLRLEARNPFEEAKALTSVTWSISASGATQGCATGGNTFATPVISLAAAGSIITPGFSDGERAITYLGELVAGEVLVFDGPAGQVTLNGVDVTPYTEGLFPRVAPGGSILSYTDDAASSHAADVTIAYRDCWW